MKNYNIQRSNVGNLGDIIKHAALLHVANRYFEESFCYVDTHSFLLETSIANIQWRQQTLQLAQQYDGYKDYYELEQVMVKKGRYWCSAGLMLNYSKAKQLCLSENNPGTHKILQQQCQDYEHIRLAGDYEHWLQHGLGFAGPSLVLLDPFCMDAKLWNDLRKFMGLLNDDGLILVFHYQNGKRFSWPEVDTWHIQSYSLSPFHLAVYSKRTINMLSLGWQSSVENSS